MPGCELIEPGAALPTARAVLPDGDVLLLMAEESPVARFAAHARDDELACVLEVTDVAPVAVAHRVRGRAWVAGWLTPVRPEERAACAMLLSADHPVEEVLGTPGGDAADRAGRRPGWTMLRLEVGEILVDDLWGAEHVDAEEFADAAPDPLARYEADLLQHLAAAHGEQVHSLTALLGDRGRARPRPCARGAGTEAAAEAAARAPEPELRAVPLALDRFGLRVRFLGSGPVFDARFDFPEPVSGHDGLRHAMHALFLAAHEERERTARGSGRGPAD